MGTNVKTDGVNRVGVFMDARHTDAFDSLRVDSFTPMAGWTFAYNINPALITTETDGANGEVTHSGNHARLSTGAAASSYAQIQTRKASRYIPGVGGLVRFTAVFSEPTEGSQQLIGLFDDQNGWGFGYDGLKFGVFRRSLGVDYWAYQDDWNVETYDRLDPTKGNVYQIEYRWLGYGAQLFAIEDWETGAVDVVHRVDYANRYAVTSIDNPNLPLTARAENTTNETDMVLRTPSAIAGLDGDAYNDAVSTIIATDVQTVPIASDTKEAILTRLGDGSVVAFENYCMHWTDVRLDRGSGAPVRDGELVCAKHGATFERDSGICNFGPCEGARLQTVDVAVEDGTVVLVDDGVEFVRVGEAESDDVDDLSTSPGDRLGF